MSPYRSRQFLFHNPVAVSVLGATAAISVGLFFLTDAWVQAWWVCVLTLAGLIGAWWIPLTVTVDESTMQITMAGVLTRTVRLDSVTSVSIEEYDPWREFGGWGWRWGRQGKDVRAYTMRGSTAVVVSTRAGSRLFIGVPDEQRLVDALSPSTRI